MFFFFQFHYKSRFLFIASSFSSRNEYSRDQYNGYQLSFHVEYNKLPLHVDLIIPRSILKAMQILGKTAEADKKSDEPVWQLNNKYDREVSD